MTSGVADRREKHRRNGEVLEQRHDVGERLVKGQHVGIARLLVSRMQAVEQGVRGLVRDDVVRQAGEDQAARQVVAGWSRAARK